MTSAVDGRDWIAPSNVLNLSRSLITQHFPNPGGSSAQIDVSQFASLVVYTGPGALATAGTFCVIQIQFLVAGTETATRQISIPSIPADPTSTSNNTFWRIPVEGDQCIINVITNNSLGWSVTLIGTTRPITEPTVSYFTQGSPALLDTGAVSVPANSNSLSYYLPPTDHGYHVSYLIASNGNATLVGNGAYVFAGAITQSVFFVGAANNGVITQVEVPVPFAGTNWFFANNTAGAVTCAMRIWLRSP